MRLVNIIFLLSVIFIFGCSGSSTNLPVTPGENSQDHGLPLIAPSEIGDIFSSIGLMGAYGLKIDKDEMSAEVVPSRYGALGESYIVSGGSFFIMTPCTDCLKIKNVSIDANDNLVLGFNIKHPFPKGDPLKPPSAINRLDLDVFDLALILQPVDLAANSYPLTGTDAYPGIILNGEGYTSELASVIGDPSVLPYKICFEDPGNNRFEMGTDYEPFDVILNPGTGLFFNLYLTMGYGASALKPQRLSPTYYIPEFNRKSAWKIVVVPPNGSDPPTMGNTWDDSDTTTEHMISIDIYDWNHGVTISSGYPDPANTDQISASSDIGSVSVEVPGMTSSIVTAITSDTSTNGWDDPITYTASFANENGLPAGEYYGMVKVTDTRVPGTVILGGESDTLVDSPDGIQLEWHELSEFATYQVFTATVVVGCGPISGSIIDPNCPVTGVTSGSNIAFTASASSANGGDPIVLYEWDMDYDGVTFDIDATGETANLGPFTNPDCNDPPVDPVTYTVAVRATDSCNPPNVTIIDTCEVTVDNCGLGNLVLVVNRLNTYTERYRIDENGPFTLSWPDGGGGVAEYALYVDRDPDDGISNNYVYVGASLTTTYTTPPSELPMNHYIKGYTYIVRARSVVGDPSTEGAESEPAHVITTGFETHPPPYYSALNGEGWLANGEGTSTDKYTRPIATHANRAHGEWAVQFSRKVGNPTTAGLWNGMVHGPHPSIPNSSVRFMDYSMLWRNLLDGGVFIGTCEIQPSSGWTSPADDFDWSSSNETSPYYAYNGYNSSICTYFNGCPSNANNVWYNQTYSMSFTRQVVGGDCNEFGDPTDQYVGIECFRSTIPDESILGDYSNMYLDEVAIAIY